MIPCRWTVLAPFTAAILLFSAAVYAGPLAQDRGSRVREVVAQLESTREKLAADLRKYDADLQQSRNVITKSQGILMQAQAQGNAPAEKIAREAMMTAQGAKAKTEELKRVATVNLRRFDDVLARVRSGGADPDASLEQVGFETMNDRWVSNQKRLIEERLQNPNPYAAEIYRSLKTKAPPELPDRKFDQLQPGDVLLISPESETMWDKVRDKSWWVNVADRGTTNLKSPASHTVLYLKEVNGTKLFLDNTPEQGTRVINEAQYLKEYGHRSGLVASVAQPLNNEEAGRIWGAAKEMSRQEADNQQRKSGNIIDQTGYGLYGNDNMVCSETSRWALIRAGREIPESASPLKRLLGIDYGPANFYSDKHNFVITPMWAPVDR